MNKRKCHRQLCHNPPDFRVGETETKHVTR